MLIEDPNLEIESLVSLLILIENKLDILTISNMARKEGKTPRGIRTSNQYRKEIIGGQLMAIKGSTENKLPF